MMDLPLQGLVILEFSQYLAGPSAGLRLADLGARVIKIEKTVNGDAGRKQSIKDLWVDDNSLLFHTINRNKESFTADLTNSADVEVIKKLITKADVLIHDFNPGEIKKTGLEYETVKVINPKIIYAEISGYGKESIWKSKPGHDLLLQSITGLTYTTGNADSHPVPFGIAIADILCGAQLVQGILAALIRRHKKGAGALIEVSLMESLLDFQFELLTTYYANRLQPQRSQVNNGHPLLSAPYGIYATSNGYIALAMMDLMVLAKAIDCIDLLAFTREEVFARRDEIKTVLARHLLSQNSAHWLGLLQQKGLWAMEVFDWEKMTAHEAYKTLDMEQVIKTAGKKITTTRCPIRVNGQKLFSGKPAPQVGQHNKKVYSDFVTP